MQPIRTRSVLRTPVRVFAVQLHSTGCSLREAKEILRSLGVKRCHQAVWQCIHRLSDIRYNPPRATPTRGTMDETAAKIMAGGLGCPLQ
ncbi:transposase [Haloferax larsenii JCM 13917]|nr:transposase [Haloferax larsenii JCM 13917]